MSAHGSLDWSSWLQRWHRQQECYLPERPRRFRVMLDYLAAARGPEGLQVLDICCGPGSLAEEVLQRVPGARVVAVDLDPWLIEMGRRTISAPARVRWIEGDLRRAEWAADLPAASFDAAVSSTALHWFQPDELMRLYQQLARLLMPGGVFINADHLPDGTGQVAKWTNERMDAWQATELARPEAESWARYWEAARAEPAFAAVLAERERRFAGRPPAEDLPTQFHRQALLTAGFQEVGEVWRQHNDAIMLAVR
jgi:ubiquinone/menaquinone biosynthesis C-methylase UbiE